MKKFEGLRKKVIKNYFKIIIITVVLFEALFLFSIKNYYYNYARQLLRDRVNNTTNSYQSLTNQGLSFEKKVNDIIEKNDSYKEDTKSLAIQIIDKKKCVLIDQYGFKSNTEINYDDVNKALKDSKKVGEYIYRNSSTGERVMSTSVAIKVNNVIEGAVRYSISLEKIDREIITLSMWLIFAGILIVIISILISLRFADSLINPLSELKEFANELAKGNFNVKLKNMNTSDDEIGDLANTFMYMAQEIDKSEKLKDEFISSISHELRTPLTSIKGWSETLSFDGITKEESALGLGIILDETERLINLVEELLDFSRLSSDRIKLKIDDTNLKHLIIGVLNQLKVKSSEKKIELVYEFEGDIKNIHADKNRLRQVLINLIQNAIKFSSENSKIEINLTQDEEYSKITVKDSGSGIEKENLEKVFDKFFQEDFNKSGSGLGLAISYEIVKLHLGEMTIDSVKGVGTVITFTLKNKLI